MQFKSGHALFERLETYLKNQRFDVEHDEIHDHEFKIDLTIRRFPQNPRLYSLGLQITERCDDPQKMKIFYEAQTTGFRVVDKSMYIEVEADDFEHGVGHLISTAVSNFQFDERFAGQHCIGVRVLRSMKLDYFDLKERIVKLTTARLDIAASTQRAVDVPSQTIPAQMVSSPLSDQVSSSTNSTSPTVNVKEAATRISDHLAKRDEAVTAPKEIFGFINGFYRTKGEGFISGQDGNSYYFKLEGVSDGKLRDHLMGLPYYETATPVEGTIAFRSVGKTRPNAKYEEARALRSA